MSMTVKGRPVLKHSRVSVLLTAELLSNNDFYEIGQTDNGLRTTTRHQAFPQMFITRKWYHLTHFSF